VWRKANTTTSHYVAQGCPGSQKRHFRAARGCDSRTEGSIAAAAVKHVAWQRPCARLNGDNCHVQGGAAALKRGAATRLGPHGWDVAQVQRGQSWHGAMKASTEPPRRRERTCGEECEVRTISSSGMMCAGEKK
jgi:hypothetical protein